MPRKLADDLIKTSEEYTKLKGSRRDDGATPRETPDHQGPGRSGLRRPELDSWTTGELREAAQDLDIEEAPRLDRDALIDALLRTEKARLRAR